MFSEPKRTVRTARFLPAGTGGPPACGTPDDIKWEKGVSVPDADMLIRISEILELSVSELLGAKITEEMNQKRGRGAAGEDPTNSWRLRTGGQDGYLE